MTRLILALVLILFPTLAQAQGRPLQLEMADEQVDITTGFDGTRIVLFGTTDRDNPNLAVTLRGPERTVIIRRKDHIMGAWMNRDSIEFRRVPSYYDYAATLNEQQLAEFPKMLEDGFIGVDHLGFYDEDAQADDEAGVFRDALIRGFQKKGFYPIKPVTPEFMSPRFFKVAFTLPPGVPTGLYTAEAIMFDGDVILARETQTLQVGQVGFNARVYLFAENHSFFYGLFAVLMALISGWSAFTFLRRD